jgi:PLP dependent protein
MDTLHTTFRDRLLSIHDRIAGACRRSGRTPDTVTLIAVTKTQPVEVLQALIDCGISHLGENRVTEILDKAPHLHGSFTMHLIGTLQTNKVARVLPFVNMVQSVDRIRLIDYLDRYTPEGEKLPVLVEVNTTRETSKSGCSPDQVRELLDRACSSTKIRPAGYMTIGPLDGTEQSIRSCFASLYTIANEHRDLVPAPHLSMGMSGDFEWAIEEGATMVRIGTLLTGAR